MWNEELTGANQTTFVIFHGYYYATTIVECNGFFSFASHDQVLEFVPFLFLGQKELISLFST